jgi:hypothetical protein
MNPEDWVLVTLCNARREYESTSIHIKCSSHAYGICAERSYNFWSYAVHISGQTHAPPKHSGFPESLPILSHLEISRLQ